MLEKDIENIIAKNPIEFFPTLKFTKLEQQKEIGGLWIDIYAETLDAIHIIEIKRGIMSRDAVGQVAIYSGLMKMKFPSRTIKMHLVANFIDETYKAALNQLGISCINATVSKINFLAEKTNYKFIDSDVNRGEIALSGFSELSDATSAAWIFQGKPEFYDVINAMSDQSVRNEFHWRVREHKQKIRIGDLVFIWMSGSEAGIYAIAKVIGAPDLYHETEDEKKYYVGDNVEDGTNLKVKLKAYSNLCANPIFKDELKSHKETAAIGILKFARGTNFIVEENEAKAILELRKSNEKRIRK